MVSHVRLSDHAIADATWGAWGLQIAFNDLSFWRQAQVPATCTSLSFTAFHCLSLHCLVPFTAFRCLSLRFHCTSLRSILPNAPLRPQPPRPLCRGCSQPRVE